MCVHKQGGIWSSENTLVGDLISITRSAQQASLSLNYLGSSRAFVHEKKRKRKKKIPLTYINSQKTCTCLKSGNLIYVFFCLMNSQYWKLYNTKIDYVPAKILNRTGDCRLVLLRSPSLGSSEAFIPSQFRVQSRNRDAMNWRSNSHHSHQMCQGAESLRTEWGWLHNSLDSAKLNCTAPTPGVGNTRTSCPRHSSADGGLPPRGVKRTNKASSPMSKLRFYRYPQTVAAIVVEPGP